MPVTFTVRFAVRGVLTSTFRVRGPSTWMSRAIPIRSGKDLSLGSRIMAVADVFTAIAEDRPYRKSMPSVEIRKVLQGMSKGGSLDPDLVSLLEDHFEEIDQARSAAQEKRGREYRRMFISG